MKSFDLKMHRLGTDRKEESVGQLAKPALPVNCLFRWCVYGCCECRLECTSARLQ